MEMPEELETIAEHTYPSLLNRIKSIFIDMLLILASIISASVLISKFEATPDWVRMVLFVGIFGVYEPLSMAFGGTVGNRLMKIQVRQYADETHNISILQSYIRFITKIMVGWISFITIHMNSQRRALHDLVGGSVMIQKK